MCLQHITNKHKKDTGFGYKVFVKIKTKLYSEMFSIGTIRPINKWLKAKSKRIRTDFKENYESGFHIFKKRKDAVEWACLSNSEVIRKIAYRKVIVSGIQSKAIVIVAKEIKILPNKRKQ